MTTTDNRPNALNKSTTSQPLVSVSILAFRHANYVREAIESVLAQIGDFELEVIVGVDGEGGDRTAEIAREYAERYPGTVRAICHPHRLPGVPGRLNNITNLEACRGKYIAMLDGDDYWIDPHKLGRQVRLLEGDASLSLSFHDVEIISSTAAGNHSTQATYFAQRQAFLKNLDTEGRLSLFEVARRGHSNIPTSSLLFLREAVLPLPSWFESVLAADFAIQLLATARGYAHYSPAVLGAYRKHESGVSNTVAVGVGWHSADNLNRKLSELTIYREAFGKRVGRFASQKSWTRCDLAQIDFEANNYLDASRQFARACMLSLPTAVKKLRTFLRGYYDAYPKLMSDQKTAAGLGANATPRSQPAAVTASQPLS